MRVQSEPARLDDRRSIVALDAAGQGHARPTQGGHPWFVTEWGFSAAPEAPWSARAVEATRALGHMAVARMYCNV